MSADKKQNKMLMRARPLQLITVLFTSYLLTACAVVQEPVGVSYSAELTPATPSTRDLFKLPPPRAR